MKRTLFRSATLLASGLALFLAAESYEPSKIVHLKIHAALHSDLPSLRSALDFYKLVEYEYPDRLDDMLQAEGPHRYLEDLPHDPWGSVYIYRRVGDSYQLYSAGKDRVDNRQLGDDVTTTYKNYGCEDYGLGCPWTIAQRVKIASLIMVALGFIGSIAATCVLSWRTIRARVVA